MPYACEWTDTTSITCESECQPLPTHAQSRETCTSIDAPYLLQQVTAINQARMSTRAALDDRPAQRNTACAREPSGDATQMAGHVSAYVCGTDTHSSGSGSNTSDRCARTRSAASGGLVGSHERGICDRQTRHQAVPAVRYSAVNAPVCAWHIVCGRRHTPINHTKVYRSLPQSHATPVVSHTRSRVLEPGTALLRTRISACGSLLDKRENILPLVRSGPGSSHNDTSQAATREVCVCEALSRSMLVCACAIDIGTEQA